MSATPIASDAIRRERIAEHQAKRIDLLRSEIIALSVRIDGLNIQREAARSELAQLRAHARTEGAWGT